MIAFVARRPRARRGTLPRAARRDVPRHRLRGRRPRRVVRVSGRVGVLVSGRGSNLQALIEAERDGRLGGQIVVVICERGNSPRPRAGSSRRDHRRLPRPLWPAARRLRSGAARDTQRTPRRPRVPGGVHASALARSDPRLRFAHPQRPSIAPSGVPRPRGPASGGGLRRQVSGATVHFVDEGLDSGPVVRAGSRRCRGRRHAPRPRIAHPRRGASDLSRRGPGGPRRPISLRGSTCPSGESMSLRPEESLAYLTKGCVRRASRPRASRPSSPGRKP